MQGLEDVDDEQGSKEAKEHKWKKKYNKYKQCDVCREMGYCTKCKVKGTSSITSSCGLLSDCYQNVNSIWVSAVFMPSVSRRCLTIVVKNEQRYATLRRQGIVIFFTPRTLMRFASQKTFIKHSRHLIKEERELQHKMTSLKHPDSKVLISKFD